MAIENLPTPKQLMVQHTLQAWLQDTQAEALAQVPVCASLPIWRRIAQLEIACIPYSARESQSAHYGDMITELNGLYRSVVGQTPPNGDSWMNLCVAIQQRVMELRTQNPPSMPCIY